MLSIALACFFISCKEKKAGCAGLKTGTFYFYPKQSGKSFKFERNDSLQTEIDLVTGDTSFWKITWQGDCQFTAGFISRTSPISQAESDFYASHTTTIEIVGPQKDYYLIKATINPPVRYEYPSDTVWLHPK